jgi:hypothetical protein
MERLGGEISFGCCFFASTTAATQKKKAPDGAVTLWPLEPQGTPVHAEDFERIKAGTLRFYVWGRANYADVSGIDRFTNFSAVVPPTDSRSSSGYRFYSLPHPQRP